MILDELYSTILERRKQHPPGSYVSSLFDKGKDMMLRKIGEEAVEVILASKSGNKNDVIREMSDLWFHCMVLMAEEGISHDDVFMELAARHNRKKG